MKSKIFMAIAALMISAGVMAQSANQQQKTQVKPQTQTAQVHQNTKTATVKTDVKKQEIKKEQGKTGKAGEVKKAPVKK